MTEEEKKAKAAADAQAIADAKVIEDAKVADQKAKDEVDANAGVVALAAKDEEIKKITTERDNYKNVALKRLGKNPGDADFVAGADETTGLTLEETVRKALLDREFERLMGEKDSEVTRMAKENAELKLALKNRPSGSTLGGGSGDGSATVEVKDNVFSAAQIETMTARAKVLKIDPQKYIDTAKLNLQKRS